MSGSSEDFKEKRRAERFPVNVDSKCDFASPVLEDFGPVKVKNLSTDGIGFFTTHNLSPGLLMAINLENPEKKFTKTFLIRVIHCNAQTGGNFLVGASFNVPLTYEELCILVM